MPLTQQPSASSHGSWANDGQRSLLVVPPFKSSSNVRRDAGGVAGAFAPPSSGANAHWMDAIDPHQPIPKLVPVRVVESVSLPTICSSARAVLGVEKYAAMHSSAASYACGAPRSSRMAAGAAQLPVARMLSPRFLPSERASMRQEVPIPSTTFKNDADASSRSLKFDGEASFSSGSNRSPRAAMAMSTSMARMQSGLFAGGRRHGGGEGFAPDPHSELRRDLSSLFLQDPRAATFFKYLVWFGGPKAKPEYAPENLYHDEHQLLGLLFGVLDRDVDGYIRTEDIKNAASVFQGKFGEYTRANFRKMDRNCEGRVDFDQFLLAFFPQHTLQSLKQLRRSLAKPLTRLVCSTRELMAASDVAEVERNFQFFVHLSQRLEAELSSGGGAVVPHDGGTGRDADADVTQQQAAGCSLPAYLSVVQDPEAKAFAEQMFYVFDTDNDGVLTCDDFLEMVKHMYPPFRKGSHGVPLDRMEGNASTSSAAGIPHVPSFASASPRKGGGPTPPTMSSRRASLASGVSGALGGRGQQTQLFAWREFSDDERALFGLYKTIASNERVLKFPPIQGNGGRGVHAPTAHHRKGTEALESIVEMRQNELMARALLR